MFAKRNKSICETELSEICPILEIIDNGSTIMCKNGNLTRLIALEGIDITGLDDLHKHRLWQLIKNFFNDIDASIRVTIYNQRVKLDSYEASNNDSPGKQGSFQNKYLEATTNTHNALFKDNYTTRTYLAISKRNLPILINGFKITSHSLCEEHLEIQRNLEHLREFCNNALKLLHAFTPQMLNGKDLMHFYSYLINGSQEIALPDKFDGLNINLCNTDIHFTGSKVVKFISDTKTSYACYLILKTYPDTSSYTTFKEIMELPFNFILMQIISPVATEKSKVMIHKNHELRYQLPGNFASGSMEQFATVGKKLDAGETKLHKHSFLIAVYADSEAELDDAVLKIRSSFFQHGINIKYNWSSNIHFAYLAMLPSFEDYLEMQRSVFLISENIADFNFWFGNKLGNFSCAFGNSPLTYFKTPAKSNYAFTLHPTSHKDDVGHTMIIGAAGSGKTTLTSFLLMQALKFPNMKLLGFDSFNGFKIAFSALIHKDCYMDIMDTKSIRLNPFLLDDTAENRIFLFNWLDIMTKGAATSNEILVTEIIDTCFHLPFTERSLTNISPLFKGGRDSIAEKIAAFTVSDNDSKSLYGNFFNGNSDNLHFAYPATGFDMGKVIKNDKLLPLFASYVFHSFESFINKNAGPHICFIDEMAQYLQSNQFSEYIIKAARQWRKRNGAIIGAVQEASSLTTTENGRNILNNCGSYILFSTPNADKNDYINTIGLNETEFNWIKNNTNPRHIMLKRKTGDTVILDIDLSHLGKHLNLFNSSIESVHLANQLIEENTGDWVLEFLTKQGSNKNARL